jgi:hypothetical protein
LHDRRPDQCRERAQSDNDDKSSLGLGRNAIDAAGEGCRSLGVCCGCGGTIRPSGRAAGRRDWRQRVNVMGTKWMQGRLGFLMGLTH